MTIDLTKKLTDFDGKPIEVAEGKNSVRDLLLYVIQASNGTDANASPAKKYERYLLSKELFNAKDKIKLTSEQISDLKDLSGKSLTVMAHGILTEALENE